jgi:hypothetical protein
MLGLVDVVDHPPLGSKPSAVQTDKFVSERLTDSIWLFQQRASGEFDRGRRHVLP